MLEAYRTHVEERAQEGLPPLPLDAEQVAALVELLRAPPAGAEKTLLDLITNRVPPGVDQAAYVKAGFLTALSKGEAKSPHRVIAEKCIGCGECVKICPKNAIDMIGALGHTAKSV